MKSLAKPHENLMLEALGLNPDTLSLSRLERRILEEEETWRFHQERQFTDVVYPRVMLEVRQIHFLFGRRCVGQEKSTTINHSQPQSAIAIESPVVFSTLEVLCSCDPPCARHRRLGRQLARRKKVPATWVTPLLVIIPHYLVG